MLLCWFNVDAHSAEHGDEDVLWHPYIEIGGAVGNARNRAEMRIFAPVFQDSRRMLFADLRGNYFSSPAGEGNIGLGYRQRFSLNAGDTDNAIYGLYGFVDIHNSSYDNVFYQTTLGGEILTQDFDLRLNGYIPLNYSNKTIPSLNQAIFTDSNLVIQDGREKPLYGVSGEIGARLWHNNKSELRLWGGGFYFSNSDVETIAGPRARAEWRLFDLFKPGARLSLAGQVRWDDVRHTDGEIGLRLRFPLGGPSYRANHRLDGLDRRMVDPIHRIDDIITQAGPYGPPEPAKLGDDGSLINGFQTVDANTDWSDVLTPAPVAAADTGSTAVVSGKLIILDGSQGEIKAPSNGLVLNNNESIIGGGHLLEVKSADGQKYAIRLPGQRATLTLPSSAPDGTTLLTVGSSSRALHLANLSLRTDPQFINRIALNMIGGDVLIENVDIAQGSIDLNAIINEPYNIILRNLKIDSTNSPALIYNLDLETSTTDSPRLSIKDSTFQTHINSTGLPPELKTNVLLYTKGDYHFDNISLKITVPELGHTAHLTNILYGRSPFSNIVQQVAQNQEPDRSILSLLRRLPSQVQQNVQLPSQSASTTAVPVDNRARITNIDDLLQKAKAPGSATAFQRNGGPSLIVENSELRGGSIGLLYTSNHLTYLPNQSIPVTVRNTIFDNATNWVLGSDGFVSNNLYTVDGARPYRGDNPIYPQGALAPIAIENMDLQVRNIPFGDNTQPNPYYFIYYTSYNSHQNLSVEDSDFNQAQVITFYGLSPSATATYPIHLSGNTFRKSGAAGYSIQDLWVSSNSPPTTFPLSGDGNRLVGFSDSELTTNSYICNFSNRATFTGRTSFNDGTVAFAPNTHPCESMITK